VNDGRKGFQTHCGAQRELKDVIQVVGQEPLPAEGMPTEQGEDAP
jgi:hypothetical protein